MHISIMTTFMELKTSYGGKIYIRQSDKILYLSKWFKIFLWDYDRIMYVSQNKLYYNNKIMSIFLGKRLSERVIL